MALIETTNARREAAADYRQRTVANLLAVAFVTALMISGYWIVTTLAG